MKRTFFLFLAVLLGVARADVLMQVELLELRQELLTELMSDTRYSGDGHALRLELQERRAVGQVSLVSLLILRGRLEEKSSLESIREVIFPSEYEPSSPPVAINLAALPSGPAPPRNAIEVPRVPPAWDMEPVGELLEMEVTRRKDGCLSFRFTGGLQKLVDQEVWTRWKTPIGNTHEIRRPTFEQLRATTGLVVLEGRYAFVAVLTEQRRPEHRLMLFVKGDLLK